MTTLHQPWFDLGVEAKALEGETVCGDLHVAQPRPHGYLLAAIDGLGHGVDAEVAARRAAETLTRHAGEPVGVLFERCHERLRRTRGATMGVASLDEETRSLEWIGVGNVKGILFRRRVSAPPLCRSLLVRAGVVGSHLPPLRTTKLRLEGGDLLVLTTDGIESSFERSVDTRLRPDAIVRRILDGFAKPSDDALALVVHYKPPAS